MLTSPAIAPKRQALSAISPHSNLDAIEACWPAAEELGVEGRQRHSVTALVRALVVNELVNPILPEGYSPGHHSRYFSTEVLSTELVERNVRLYAEREFKNNLDNVTINGILANALNLTRKQSAPTLAAALVGAGLINKEIPEKYTPRADSNYFNPAIVGAEQVLRNMKQFFERVYGGNIDLIQKNSIYESLLETRKGSCAEVARRLIVLGIASGKLPPGFMPANATSLFLRDDIVGEENVAANISAMIVAKGFNNLDAVERDGALGTVLGADRPESPLDLARALIKAKKLSSRVPENYIFCRGTRYFDPALVGEDLVYNLREYAKQVWQNDLDLVEVHSGIATALSVDDHAGAGPFIRRLIEAGVISPCLPEGHSIQHSRYIVPKVVGHEHAARNVKLYIQRNFTHPREITKYNLSSFYSLCEVLGCAKTIIALREHCVKEGWLTGAHDSALTALPAEFARRNEPSAQAVNRNLRPIGMAYRSRSQRSLLVKGEAFEQLVGVTLALLYPAEKVLGQYCLNVDPQSGFYGTRVDFRVGKQLVEAKWGRADGNIRETAARHLALKPRAWKYSIVCLRVNRALGMDHTPFCRLVSELACSAELIAVARAISRAAGAKRANELEALRDYLYSTIRLGNELEIVERASFIQRRLAVINSSDSSQREKVLRAATEFTFPPLLAHLEYKGQMYRTMIPAAQLCRERPQDFKPVYLLDTVAFEHALDRDIAVMIELCGAVRRIEECLPVCSKHHSLPVFNLPDGRKISSHPLPDAIHIATLADLPRVIKISSEDVRFGLDYISYCGFKC